ncbi:MAG: hypothetical protein Kow00124_15260 [Anaerolineae bacterium]
MPPQYEAHILIVEDQRISASVLRTSLELYGRSLLIIDVPSGEEALLEARRTRFDLVITSHRLPGISGPELIEQLRLLNPETHFIVTTSRSPAQIAASIEGLGVAEVFTKPVDTELFTAAVERLLFGSVEPIATETAAEVFPLPGVDQEAIDRLLGQMQADLGALGVLLIGRDGRAVLGRGNLEHTLPLDDLAVLLAAGLDPAPQIAALLGGAQKGALYYYSGALYDVYLLSVGPDYAAAVVFPAGSLKQMGPVLRYGMPIAGRMLGYISPAVMEAAEPEPAPAELEAAEPESAAPEAAAPYPEPEPPLAAVEPVSPQGEPLPEIDDSLFDELDLGDLDASLEGIDDLDSFWEEAADEADAGPEAGISLDEARRLGLLPDESDEGG